MGVCVVYMGIRLDEARHKLIVVNSLAKLQADVAQLTRAYLRRDKKGARRNAKQIIKSLGKISDLL